MEALSDSAASFTACVIDIVDTPPGSDNGATHASLIAGGSAGTVLTRVIPASVKVVIGAMLLSFST